MWLWKLKSIPLLCQTLQGFSFICFLLISVISHVELTTRWSQILTSPHLTKDITWAMLVHRDSCSKNIWTITWEVLWKISWVWTAPSGSVSGLSSFKRVCKCVFGYLKENTGSRLVREDITFIFQLKKLKKQLQKQNIFNMFRPRPLISFLSSPASWLCDWQPAQEDSRCAWGTSWSSCWPRVCTNNRKHTTS